jgi:signal transduction histidine kinase/DNA-binding NarL/FixJ family response regulator
MKRLAQGRGIVREPKVLKQDDARLAARAAVAPPPMRVLVVEDSILSARVLCDMLDAEPDITVVDVATTGQEGVRRAGELQPDVVLMDIHLPDIDGIQATWLIISQRPACSVIMVTSEERTEYLQRAMVAGAQGYLLKPIRDPTQMAQSIRIVRQRALERRAALAPGTPRPAARVSSELAARAEGAEALHRIAANVAGRRDPREIAENAVAALLPLYHAEAGTFYLLDEHDRVDELIAAGLSPEFVAALRLGYTQGPRCPLWCETRAVAIGDVGNDPAVAALRVPLVAEGLTSLVLVPAISEGRALGGLVLYHRQPRNYVPHELQLLETFAAELAGAIKLAQAYAAVEALDRQREEFLALVSHELRQPVAAIAVAAEAIAGTPGLSPAEQRALGSLRRQAHRLARLAEDVLDVARVETGQLQLQPAELDLTALIAALVRQAGEPRLQLAVRERPIWVEADAERLGQAFDNLVSNALKYSRATDPVAVEVSATQAEARVAVRDRGVGLGPEEVAQLFQKYGRVRNDSTAGIEGIGLGLYLSRLMVEAHGGSIAVTSPGRGQGSEFTIMLPRCRWPEGRQA